VLRKALITVFRRVLFTIEYAQEYSEESSLEHSQEYSQKNRWLNQWSIHKQNAGEYLLWYFQEYSPE